MSLFYRSALDKIALARSLSNPDRKGDLFEEAACEILTSIPGLLVHRRNVVTPDGSQEIDVIIRQDRQTPLWFLGLACLIECKCIFQTVSSKELTHFAEKLVTAGVPYGIIFSVNGVSGSDNTHANAVILRYRERSKNIISISLDEVEGLSGPDQLVGLIIEKYLALLEGVVL